jgi:GNAT superfamily N-acetyltransferase
MADIVVQEATDADIPQACILETLAYADNAANPVLFPGPFPSNAREQRVEQVIEMRKNDSTAVFLKAVDTATGEMLAFAKWHVFETEEIAKQTPTRPLRFGEGSNQEACKAFFGGLVSKKKEIMGSKPHLCKLDIQGKPTCWSGCSTVADLHMLHTNPKQQGRGAGSMLLKWGTQKADQLGLPVYLESSPDAHGFYKKYGFADVYIMELDLSLYGGENRVHTAPLMIRQPSKVVSTRDT